MDPFLSMYRTIRRMTMPVILRKLEVLFYFIFTGLAIICFILPHTLGVGMVASYSAGAISILYNVVIYYARFKMNVIFAIIMHFSAFLLTSSFIIFDFGLLQMGLVFVGLAVIGISTMMVLCGLGHKVFINEANDPPVNRAWTENNYQENADGEVVDQIRLNPWHFNDDPPAVQDQVNPEVLNVAEPQMQVEVNVNPQNAE